MKTSLRQSPQTQLTWAQIDCNAIAHNIRQIQRLALQNRFFLPTRPKNIPVHPMEILPVIKADAYGHGMENIAKCLLKLGIRFFGVSDVAEGLALRQMGIKKSILLFESPLLDSVPAIVDHHLIPTVCSLDLAHALNDYAKKKGKRVMIHVKVDTGMGRLGIWHEEAFAFVRELFQLRHLIIQGIYTHFPVADTNRTFTKKQIDILYRLVTALDQKGMVIPYIHAANSMGLMGYQTHVLNFVRPGIMVYGLYPDLSWKNKIQLKPAMSIHSKVIFVKTIQKGQGISYGRTFIAPRKMSVATIPIGYSDGYFRCFSSKAQVLIKGQRCPVLGRVTMDQIIVDISRLKNIQPQEPVVILGRQGKEDVSADELAKTSGTINYEIVCSLGNRLPRVYTSV
jgi:alanine racemase